MVKRQDEDYLIGMLSSIMGHIVICLMIYTSLSKPLGDFAPPTVYSISIEGGKNIGGQSQVPAQDKTPLAPMKNVSSESPPETDKSTKPEQSKDKLLEPEDDAEISLVQKPSPTPSAKPSATPEPKESPKKVDKQVKATPTAAPTKQATPKKTAQQINADLNKDYQKAMQRYLGESSDAGGKGFGAAKIGGNGMGGGVVRPPEFFTYRDLLQRHVKHEWRWYDNRANLVTQVAFELDPNGTIRNIRVVRSSGSSEYDDSVMRALVKANPAPMPPESVYNFFRSVTMTFDPRE